MQQLYDGNNNLYLTDGGAYKLLSLNLCTNITFITAKVGCIVYGQLPNGNWCRITQVFDASKSVVDEVIFHNYSNTGLTEFTIPFLARELNLSLNDKTEAEELFAGKEGVCALLTYNSHRFSTVVAERIIIEIMHQHPRTIPLGNETYPSN